MNAPKAAATNSAGTNTSGVNTGALLSTGAALHSAGQLAQAEAVYRQILAAEPNNPEALHLLGVIALQTNQPAVAVGLISQAIQGNRGNPGYFSNLGSALRRLGRLDEAIAAGRQAVAMDGRFADGLANLANALQDKGLHGEAADMLTRLVELRPQLVDQRLQLARALILANRPAEAVAALEALLRLRPGTAPAYINLGVALKKLGRVEEAIAAYRRALEFSPGDPGALNNLGTALQEEDRYAEAIACFRESLAARPDSADTHLNLSLALRVEGKTDEAIAEARTAISLNPALAEAHTSLGFCLLLKGELREGFAEYEWRSRMADFSSPRRSFPSPAWDGGDPQGKTILIHDEQGVGDAIQFARYAQLVKARGGRAIIECNTLLTRLLGSMPDIDGVVGRFTALPPHDAHVSLLSLPHLLGTTLETIPDGVPYLKAEPELAAAWADRLGPRQGLRVGLVWAGNPEFKDDRNRSPGLRAFRTLLEVPGIAFYALQKGAGRRDLEEMRGELPDNFVDLGDGIANFADTAAIMANLDLVISSCTGPAHLAGALGRPTWTVLPEACDWRWLDRGSFTPWYPTMRLFRQERRGDWTPVLARVKAALEEAVRTRS